MINKNIYAVAVHQQRLAARAGAVRDTAEDLAHSAQVLADDLAGLVAELDDADADALAVAASGVAGSLAELRSALDVWSEIVLCREGDHHG